MARHIERRKFLVTLGGAAAAWPLAARAQQPDQMRRIGVLMGSEQSDPDSQVRLAAFRQVLRQLGWTEGRNIRIDERWGAANPETHVAELVGSAPDAVLAHTAPVVAAVKRETRTVPIVFVMVPAPVEIGLVASLARPGGNITGFTHFELTMAGKWLEALKEISPRVKRVAFLLHPEHPAWAGYLRTVKDAASSFDVEVIPAGIRDAGEIERVIDSFAREPNGGLFVLPDIVTYVHRELIIALAARHRLPAIYPFRYFPAAAGLMSYGADPVDMFRRAAAYIDRILKGEKPADLPVQAPTKYELVINLKTAKALGLEVPPMLLARADEVIE
jgi:putative tryptophan/tyrosine transport system substrate-binding protein